MIAPHAMKEIENWDVRITFRFSNLIAIWIDDIHLAVLA